MQVHPAIAALRNDPVSQRRSGERAKAAFGTWHSRPEIRALRRELAAYSEHGGIARCPALIALMSDPESSQALVQDLCAAFVAVLRDEPLAEWPFRHGWGEGFSRVMLLQEGGATLALCTYSPGAQRAEPEAVRFVDGATHEIVIAGTASGRLYSRGANAGMVAVRDCQWRAGDRIERRPRDEARAVLAVGTTLLLLQLARVPERPGPSTLVRIEDGATIQQVSGDRRASEQVMALGVLGALGQSRHAAARDLADPIARFAMDAANDPDARWEAVRQLLALDTARGFALLGRLAAAANDPLANPACALRDQLVAAHPQLHDPDREALPCPC